MRVAPRPDFSQFVIAFTVVTSALGCTTTPGSGPGDSSAPLACEPGQSIPCGGPVDCIAYRICGADGKDYGACQCGVLPDASASDGAEDVYASSDASVADSNLGDAEPDSPGDASLAADGGWDATLSDSSLADSIPGAPPDSSNGPSPSAEGGADAMW